MFEVSKMPHVWTHAEYADMVYTYGFYGGSSPVIDSFQTAEFRTEECFPQTVGSKSVF